MGRRGRGQGERVCLVSRVPASGCGGEVDETEAKFVELKEKVEWSYK